MSEAAGEVLGECPSEEIGAYLDAELPPDRATALEAHLTDCAVCRSELNSQKLFLLELSRSLEQESPIELPKDFTKAIVTKAESSVSGLRKRSERVAAAGIVALLLVLAAVGFVGDWSKATAEAARPIGMFGAFFEVVAGLLQSVVFTAGFVLRKVFTGTAGAVLFAVVLIASASAGLFFFRRSRGATGEAG